MKQELLIILPTEYWSILYDDYLIKLINLNRVNTISEAFDRLDEQIHHWNMEASQTDLIRMEEKQTSILNTLQGGTFGTTLSLLVKGYEIDRQKRR